MEPSLSQLPLWLKALLIYLAIGYCTQLPGVAFGHFLSLPYFRRLRRRLLPEGLDAPLAETSMKILMGLVWLLITTPLWPMPLLRAGLNIIAMELVTIGLIGAILMLTVVDSITWLAIVVAAMTIVSLLLARRHLRSGTTRRDLGTAERRNRSPFVQKADGVFLSYKTEDVTVVRQIAEQLIARDIAVWFAEYAIPIGERSTFQESIDAGIRGSKYGVCFTNNRYADSPYCRRELQQLLDPTTGGSKRVIEFRFPTEARPHKVFPQLASAYSVEYEGVEHSVRLITSALNMPSLMSSTSHEIAPNPRAFEYRGREYRLDFAGWESVDSKHANRRWGPDVRGPRFSTVCGGNPMWGHVLVGPQDVSRSSIAIGTLDDRRYYEEALRFADAFFRSVWQQKMVGVHLIFAGGFSHMALTTLFKAGIWSRIYSVVLPFPGEPADVEFAFFFFKGSFRQFCENAYRMDRMVESIRWD